MKRLTGFIGVIAIACCAPLAYGDIQLSYQVGGGAATICGTNVVTANPNGANACDIGPTNIGSGLVLTNFSVDGSQVPGSAQEFGGALKIQNTSGSTETLTLYLADQNFSSPTTPPSILYSSELGISATAGKGTVNLESCADTTNGLAPPTTAFCSAGPSLTNVTQSYNGSSSANNTVSEIITSLSAPYSLSQEITLSLGAGSSVNISTSQILTPVPEPASLALFGSGLLGIGLLARRKLRSKRS